MYCNTNRFTVFTFCGPNSKHHGARGMSKHYHLRFDPKIGNNVYTIRRIPCACVTCTSILDKIWISGIQSNKQERYKPVTKCTYWTFLGPFKNWNIIQLSHNSTPYEVFDEIHQVVIDGISDNTALLFESGNMVQLKQLTQKLMDFMLSCSHQKHTHFRITPLLTE